MTESRIRSHAANTNGANKCNILSPNSLRTLPSHHSLSSGFPVHRDCRSNSPQLCGLLSRTRISRFNELLAHHQLYMTLHIYPARLLACITALHRRARDTMADVSWLISILTLHSLRGDSR
ncbi:uncharacterized protein PODANS_4_3025 [Podospora anserina S mat+]|uniref:Podospora anserina S mat+ genomic DNA chromosome 4, supercontig 2 n=1 Tax=Podospora anserina (strain S / ATCC MYA-4624 / DSM 980 / FGSC 10383) TaxID=515849 RepID=B2AE68_PODAN|nr:uncharacterized protein PODANS_4_3025 [Podospora anserina S mat+]CAP61734.1 unnamed protein product [Podospora anserina S mat+]CDP28081.1 Putative protein of unknown function [Podospora anserina S mat+]